MQSENVISTGSSSGDLLTPSLKGDPPPPPEGLVFLLTLSWRDKVTAEVSLPCTLLPWLSNWFHVQKKKKVEVGTQLVRWYPAVISIYGKDFCTDVGANGKCSDIEMFSYVHRREVSGFFSVVVFFPTQRMYDTLKGGRYQLSCQSRRVVLAVFPCLGDFWRI